MAFNKIGAYIKSTGKVIVGAAGLLLVILNEALPILPDQYKTQASAVIAVLTVIAGFQAPYTPLPATRRSVKRTAAKKPRPRKVAPAVPDVKLPGAKPPHPND